MWKGENMRYLLTSMCLVSFYTLVGEVTLAAEKCSPVKKDAQMIPENLNAVLVQKRSAFGDSWWPTDLASRPVNPGDIPKNVLTKATTWLRTMIKAQWLPDDPNAWMIGVRKESPSKADYLILRYEIENKTVQIQENGASVRILIDTGARSEMKPEAFLTSVVNTFLRFPEDRFGTLAFCLKRFQHDGVSIWHGTMDCDFDRYDQEAYFRRIWYNHTDVWTDGRRAFFGLIEKDGRPWKPTRARPGIPRRFKPAE
jgi:hypothetical protein